MMDITLQAVALYITLLLTGLSAGLFFAWQVSVIPGTKLIRDTTYIETMQKINRAIINPPFILIFLGSLLMQILSVILFWDTGWSVWLILGATVLYGIGTVMVTGLGNVPLNNSLDTLPYHELNADRLSEERDRYEIRWNRFHVIRTVYAMISFMLLLVAVFIAS